jgi:hypothetical protein
MTQTPPLRIQRSGSARALALWFRTHARLALLLLLMASGILGPLAQNAGTLFSHRRRAWPERINRTDKTQAL